MKWSRMNEAQKERQREMCRAWYHRNIEAQRERSRKRRERERLERELAGLPPKRRMNVRRFTAEELAERKREQNKAWYCRVMSDPDRYARYAERRRKYYEEHREKFAESRRKWRLAHPEYEEMRGYLEYDAKMKRCSESAEYYAHHLEVNRKIAIRYLRRSGKVKSKYKPRMNMRIPYGCTFGNVLDRRSPFFRNNMTASAIRSCDNYAMMLAVGRKERRCV